MSTAPDDTKSGYTFGYSKATTSSHASRTIYSDASFVIPHVKPHHKILDVGCGPGTITIGFASLIDPSQGGSVTGIDAGEPVLQAARDMAAAAAAAATAASRGDLDVSTSSPPVVVTFQQGDVLQTLPFPDATFDIVFTSQTLGHLAPAPEAPVAALREMRRVLKPGGVLAARDAASLTYQPFRAELQTCLTDRMYRVIGTGEPCGLHMPRYLRLAGWDMMPDHAPDTGKVQIGGGTTIVTGRDKVRWWRDTMGGRLTRGDPFREGWLKAGITEEECDETKALLDKWAESEDAWYGALQSEVLAWK